MRAAAVDSSFSGRLIKPAIIAEPMMVARIAMPTQTNHVLDVSGVTRLEPVPLAAVVEREAMAFRDASQIRIAIQLSPVSRVLGDPIELGRVFANLFENARRYGRTSETTPAEVQVGQLQAGPWIIVTVRDRGPGVPVEKLTDRKSVV